MRLSILIVNWNSKDHVRRCLHTIRETCAEISPQVVVVDGGSFDGCGEMLKTEFPFVEFVQSPDNVGFARCNNLGFERVTGEALLLLNPDTELKPGAVRSLLRRLEQLPGAGILGPRLLNSDGTLQTSCVRAFPTPINQALDSDWLRARFPRSHLWGTYEAFGSSIPVVVEALSGACMLLWSETYRKVGGFSPEFFMYGEDYDICLKVHHVCFKNYYVPDAGVIHHGSQSSGQQIKRFSVVLMRESDGMVIRKWQGAVASTCYQCLMGLSAVLRLGILAARILLSQGSRRTLCLHSIMKWWFTLRWALGGERWSRGISLSKGACLEAPKMES